MYAPFRNDISGAPLVVQVVKHNPELAQLVVANGGVAALVDSVSEASGNDRLPGIMALGYIAAFSETLALAVISERGLVQSQYCHSRFFKACKDKTTPI